MYSLYGYNDFIERAFFHYNFGTNLLSSPSVITI